MFRLEASDVRWVGEILCASVEDGSVVSERKRATFRRNARSICFKVKNTGSNYFLNQSSTSLYYKTLAPGLIKVSDRGFRSEIFSRDCH